jgi:hypothetical protein
MDAQNGGLDVKNRAVVLEDSQHLDEEQDPDPHLSEKLDPDPDAN